MKHPVSRLAYSLTDIVDENDARYGMTNYNVTWPGGWTTDCTMHDRATAARWAEREIADAGYMPYESAAAQ